MREIGREIGLALGFLTTLPVPQVAYVEGRLGRAGRWFSLVGLLLGLLLLGIDLVLRAFFPDMLRGVLVVALWAVLTGGLHLDGLADCCDALPAAVSRERRLEILRDPRIGAFGATGLFLFLLLKSSTTAALVSPVPALILAPAWARWLLLLAARQPAARPGGMGAAFAMSLTWRHIWTALIPTVGVLGWAMFAADGISLRPLVAVAAMLAVGWGAMRAAHARLGGMTGDVFGFVVESGELAILLIYASY